MSIQAVAWVLSQKGEDLPGTARLVMIALANHADHTSGHCWPSYETIAKEAGCHERTVGRYLGALRRNGFIDMRQTLRKDGKFRSNDYWLLFDRKSAPWQYYDQRIGNEEPEESVADLSQDNLTDGQCETALHEESDGPSDTGVPPHIMLEPSESEPSAEPPATMSRVGLNLPWPKEFVASARAEQKAKLQAAEEAKKPKRIPVIQGTRPWKAWIEHGHPPTLVGTIEVDGRRDRGWYFPTLYPPKATGPPPESNLMTSKDYADFK
jgi:Helix-turn-helix domain